ncbi:MAG: HAD family hydrolase [Deltaproteobacteria bacterium]|nr:HAD family hydrolase [Deltaproteobacteria bacterium]
MKTREEALALLKEYTTSESLLKHSLAVEAAMRWYAKHFDQPGDEVEKWGITGLIHDFDYEKYPEPVEPDGHPYIGNRILAECGYPDDVRRAIMGHATYSGVPRDTLMAKALFAVDELSGLITASALIRPDKSINNLEVSSVKKKMKDKRFAAGCNREDIALGTQELGIEMEQHIGNVIQAMRAIAPELGLN